MMFNLFSLFKKKTPEIYFKIGSESKTFLALNFNKSLMLKNFEELLEVGLKPVSGGEFEINYFFVIFEKLPNYDQSKLQNLLTKWLSNG